MQYEGGESDAWSNSDEGIVFLDDASVELIEEPVSHDLESMDTRIWIRPYAAR